ncbi:hypothetical protein ACFQ8E_02885 [Isoptericola sp. NPDC056573]|uniref:hypothetical protein n=1 Tax=Isoptericola sp. NPDC056573 TaxID=3345868 RepID=UPI003685AE6C
MPAAPRRSLQSHGLSSRVYVPILLHIFRAKYAEGMRAIPFTLDDVRDAALALDITVRNPADLVYRMRSRTVIPAEITAHGFYIIRQIGRGSYSLEKASSAIIELPDTIPTEALDLTPLPVRRLLPENLADVDEQALLSVVTYCQLLDHFTALRVFRLRSHVRKSVNQIGQAELDELDVGVAVRDDELPVVIPIEAKAVADPVNRVQIATQVAFCKHYFPRHEVRPLAIKVDERGILHFLEFNVTTEPSEVSVTRAESYRLKLSDAQLALVRDTKSVVL